VDRRPRPGPQERRDRRDRPAPLTAGAHAYPQDVALADGRTVRLRPIAHGDAEALRDGMAHLSDEARYQRFLAPVSRLSDAQVSYFVDVDHHDHEALVAVDPGGGELVAVARYIRLPEDRDVAELAAVVLDSWQGVGLGTLLSRHLADLARGEGVHYMSALVLANNDAMIDMLGRLGPVVSRKSASGTVELVVELAAR